MIFTILQKSSRKHLGIVNEPSIADAINAANKRFGRVWDEQQKCFLALAVDIEPGHTQLGMELHWPADEIKRMLG